MVNAGIMAVLLGITFVVIVVGLLLIKNYKDKKRLQQNDAV